MARPVARRAAGWLLLGAAPLLLAASQWPALDVYARVVGQMERTGLGAPTLDELVWASLRGAAQAQDPHSNFYDPATWARLQAVAEGRQVGLGVVLAEAPCGRRIQRVLSGGPADRAGLRAGDCVLAVDGQSLAGVAESTLAARLEGPEGTEVALEIERPGGGAGGQDPERRRVLLLRRRIVEPALTFEQRDAVLVARLTEVRQGTAAELARRLAEPPEALILDVRGNPGGRLQEAVAIADLFLDAGPLVVTEGRSGQESWVAGPGDALGGRGLVILVDGGTGSAAEIIAGALQRAGRARLVGAPTYGKSTVQGFYHYEDGSTLKLTEARWRLGGEDGALPPFRPDLVVDAAPVDPRARLRTHLERLAALSEAERAQLLAELDALPPGPSGDDPEAPSSGADRALEAALALLRTP